MDTKELIDLLEFEYYAILAANPTWNKSLAQFLRSRKVSREDIWDNRPSAAEAEGWKIPEWL